MCKIVSLKSAGLRAEVTDNEASSALDSFCGSVTAPRAGTLAGLEDSGLGGAWASGAQE
jgi:hypothetical protein